VDPPLWARRAVSWRPQQGPQSAFVEQAPGSLDELARIRPGRNVTVR
jgi:hypothetical protein